MGQGQYSAADVDQKSGQFSAADIDPEPPPEPEKKGFLATAVSDIGNLLHYPTAQNPYPGMGQEEKGAAAAESHVRDQSRDKAGYGKSYRAIAPVAEALGTNVSGMEQDAKEGNEAGVMGHAAAGAAPAISTVAAEAVPRVIPPVVRGGAKGINTALEHAPGVLGAAAGAAVGHATGIPEGGLLGAVAGRSIGKGLLPKLRVPGENFGRKTPAIQTEAAPAPQAIPAPAQAIPTAPPEEDLTPQLQQSVDAAKGKAISTSPSKVQDLIEQGLGGKALDPKVPLRMQKPTGIPTTAPDLPEGHIPVDSSAIKSFKYDNAAKEFHARATSGDTTYVYGDVSPAEVREFEQAESKGKAWQQIRRNPLVAKIVNGKRVEMKPQSPR